MARLALAVAFLSVFGIVAYAIVLLLKNYFQQKEQNQKEQQNGQSN